MNSKPPEWQIIYEEWAIHTPTGRLRHLTCKRDIAVFCWFKKNAKVTIYNKKSNITQSYYDPSFHSRRELLMKRQIPFTHLCQGIDPYEEIEEITIPAMVVEIALCHMKI